MSETSTERGFNFRSFISLLEKRGDLIRIQQHIDPKFELPAVLWKLQEQGKGAVFENVHGSPFSVAGGLFPRMERLGLALGITPTREFITMQDTGYLDAALARPLPYRSVETGPVQKVLRIGSDIDVKKLPVPSFYEYDSGPFVTGGIGIVRHTDTGKLNAGIYRILVLGRDLITINAGANSDLSRIYRAAQGRHEKLSIAVAIGVPPALLVAAASKTPRTISEFDVAGALRGKPLDMVQCRTCDLFVPADAEIVIEGEVDFSQSVENILGEAGAQYRSRTNPVTQVTCISHRQDAIFYAIHAGPSPEHLTLGAFSIIGLKAAFIAAVEQKFSAIKEAHLYTIGDGLHLAVTLKKKECDAAMRLIREFFAMPKGFHVIYPFIKRLIVVDADIDIYTCSDIEWAVWNRVHDAERIVLLPGMPEEPSAGERKSIRVGIDATGNPQDAAMLKKVRNPLLENIILENYL
ncbi:MAG: UbiD family decarboxylase [Deltaproteobacteria bacterium]|nr:UbiD family decarboxylase [Deltaproteobacteria bacterium]